MCNTKTSPMLLKCTHINGFVGISLLAVSLPQYHSGSDASVPCHLWKHNDERPLQTLCSMRGPLVAETLPRTVRYVLGMEVESYA